MLRPLRRSLALAVGAAALVVPRLAFGAGATDECIAASEHAQKLRNEGKLTAARDELVVCSKPECPQIVQIDCTRWMGEVLEALPSVVPAAKDPNGKDVVEARFLIDGKVATEALDGRPVPVDTGVHVFRVEASGMNPVEERVVVRAGEQNRVVTWKLEVATPPAPVVTAPVHPRDDVKRSPLVPILIGAAGVVFLSGALYMDLSATGDAHDLRSTCAPNCKQSDVDDIKTRYVIAGVWAGIGAAALVTAGVFYFMGRKGSNSGIAVAPLMNGGAMAQGRISF